MGLQILEVLHRRNKQPKFYEFILNFKNKHYIIHQYIYIYIYMCVCVCVWKLLYRNVHIWKTQHLWRWLIFPTLTFWFWNGKNIKPSPGRVKFWMKWKITKISNLLFPWVPLCFILRDVINVWKLILKKVTIF